MIYGEIYKRVDGSYVINDGRYQACPAESGLSAITSEMVEAYLASLTPEERSKTLVPEPVPSPPGAEEIERQRVAGIMASLAALDARAIRPMRAKLAGSATVQDEETLAEIEAEAEAKRGTL